MFQDEESRCYSDSLVELTELGSEAGSLNLDTIKKNLNRVIEIENVSYYLFLKFFYY